jgi:hypothetical protein
MLPCLVNSTVVSGIVAAAAAVGLGSRRLLHVASDGLASRAAAAGQPTHYTHPEVII